MLDKISPNKIGQTKAGVFEVSRGPSRGFKDPDFYIITLLDFVVEVECRYRPALPEFTWLLPSAGEYAYVTLRAEQDQDGDLCWRVEQIIPENIEGMMRSITWSRCPRPEWISTLGYLVERHIRSQHIICFLANVLRQNEIMDPFLTFCASRNVHHSERGGLFEHSVQTAVQLADIAARTDSPPLERECCIVGMLFHDIGKIIPTVSKTGLHRSREHSALPNRIFPEALAALKTSDRTTWEVLEYVLGVISGTHDDSRIPLTKFIRPVDQYQAAEDARNRTARCEPSSFGCIIAHTGRVYYLGANNSRWDNSWF